MSVVHGVLEPKIECERVSVWYGDKQALRDVSLGMADREVTALIGPSGCGKSTLLRALNRMHDEVPGTRVEGTIRVGGQDIHDPRVDVVDLRRRVGMVFQRSNPFAKSIFDNVAFGLRIAGMRDRHELAVRVEACLRAAALWDEVKGSLHASALALSGGQQQRLCIARALAVEPDVLLMDEPASALDPVATEAIESLIGRLAERYCIVIVTHSLSQARRVSQHTAFFYMGELVEHGPTAQVLEAPRDPRTQGYVRGRFG